MNAVLLFVILFLMVVIVVWLGMSSGGPRRKGPEISIDEQAGTVTIVMTIDEARERGIIDDEKQPKKRKNER